MIRCGVVALPIAIILALPSFAGAQDAKTMVAAYIDENADSYGDIAQEIWELAELGYMETESSALLQSTLNREGFEVEAGVAGIPTAFVASWKNGDGPIVGIMAEYDALPGITQDRQPIRAPIEGKPQGHACGPPPFRGRVNCRSDRDKEVDGRNWPARRDTPVRDPSRGREEPGKCIWSELVSLKMSTSCSTGMPPM